jgi:hypothetical protein
MNTTTILRPRPARQHEMYGAGKPFGAEQRNDQQQRTPRRTTGAAHDRSNDMYLIIEDLVRDRIRQIRHDAEQARQVRAQRARRRLRGR